MESEKLLLGKIEAIQSKLWEINQDCNRLKEVVGHVLRTEARPPVAEVPPVVPPPLHKPVTPPPLVVPQVKAPREPQPVVPPPAAKPVAAKKPAALELFIGGNVLGKIGIGILVLGIGIFVKYAIDHDWVGAVGRVMIGLLSGGILLSVAHWLRKSLKSFSSVLVGGGMTVLYTTLFFAYHTYHLLPQGATFALMCVLTVFTVIFSIGYNRQEIAIMGMLGGFVTPFLVSDGSGNYIVLFTYLLILNGGMIALSWFRKWPLLNMLSFGLTVLVYAGWFISHSTQEGFPAAGAVFFSTAFLAVFFAMNLVSMIRRGDKLHIADVLLILTNSIVFYTASMLALAAGGLNEYMGIYTAALALLHFAVIFPLRHYFRLHRNAVRLLTGMALALITLAIPVQLEGHSITLVWAVEAALVLWLAERNEMGFLRTGGFIVSALAAVGLIADWAILYDTHIVTADYQWVPNLHTILFNKAVLTTVTAAASFFAIKYIARSKPWSVIYLYAGLVILLAGFSAEIWHQTYLRIDHTGFAVVCAGIFAGFFASGAALGGILTRNKSLLNSALVTAGIIFTGLFAEGARVFSHIAADQSGSHAVNTFYWVHWLVTACLGTIVAIYIAGIKTASGYDSVAGKLASWFLGAATVAVASFGFFFALRGAGVGVNATVKVALPILWGALGSLGIVLGIRMRMLQLRLFSLALLALTLLKLFAYDIQQVHTAGKIAAFVSLGVLLLLISFLYQKLRVLITDEREDEAKEGVV